MHINIIIDTERNYLRLSLSFICLSLYSSYLLLKRFLIFKSNWMDFVAHVSKLFNLTNQVSLNTWLNEILSNLLSAYLLVQHTICDISNVSNSWLLSVKSDLLIYYLNDQFLFSTRVLFFNLILTFIHHWCVTFIIWEHWVLTLVYCYPIQLTLLI